MNNLEKLSKLTAGNKSTWQEEAKWREANEEWLSLSFDIAMRVLETLKAKGMTQKDLAEKMRVTPQFVNKVIKGQENLSLETIEKLGKALDIKLIKVITNDEVCDVVYTVEQAYEIVENYRQGVLATMKKQGIEGLQASRAYQAKGQLQFKQANGN